MSLKDCLIMEFLLALRATRQPDFYEGVRAVLIDKDGDAHWEPAQVEDVVPELVNSLFEPSSTDGLFSD